MTFIQKLDLMSREARTTSYSVCRTLNFSNATLTSWRNGKKPSTRSLESIADYFGVPVETLENDDMSVPNDILVHLSGVGGKAFRSRSERDSIDRFFAKVAANEDLAEDEMRSECYNSEEKLPNKQEHENICKVRPIYLQTIESMTSDFDSAQFAELFIAIAKIAAEKNGDNK